MYGTKLSYLFIQSCYHRCHFILCPLTTSGMIFSHIIVVEITDLHNINPIIIASDRRSDSK